jgi:hypothetical protein
MFNILRTTNTLVYPIYNIISIMLRKDLSIETTAKN